MFKLSQAQLLRAAVLATQKRVEARIHELEADKPRLQRAMDAAHAKLSQEYAAAAERHHRKALAALRKAAEPLGLHAHVVTSGFYADDVVRVHVVITNSKYPPPSCLDGNPSRLELPAQPAATAWIEAKEALAACNGERHRLHILARDLAQPGNGTVIAAMLATAPEQDRQEFEAIAGRLAEHLLQQPAS